MKHSCAIFGCGPIGLNAIQGAVLEQAAMVIAIDRDPARLALAARLGATHTLPADEYQQWLHSHAEGSLICRGVASTIAGGW